MDKLWAPWRIKYTTTKNKKGCVFCKALKKKGGKSYIVFDTLHSACILNAFPYNNGHLMVFPKKHTAILHKLNDAGIIDLIRALEKTKELLDKTLRPHGYNIGINIAKTAGAGITGHLHIHIVPRWQGDTNFMPVLHNTKVISQSLEELCKKLKKNVNAKTN